MRGQAVETAPTTPRTAGLSGRAPLARTFGAVVFDWDGTAVADRRSSALAVRAKLERLSEYGVHVAVVTGTHVANIDGQLGARPQGPGRLFLAVNRGSELFEVGRDGPLLLDRRDEDPATSAKLDRTAELLSAMLHARGLDVEIVSSRLNRRKVDLLPVAAWADPPKARIAELLDAARAAVRRGGFAGLDQVVNLALQTARECGLDDPRVTSDAKHVEIGTTDKSDAMRSVARHLERLGVGANLILVLGDEFGGLDGAPGSDALLMVPEVAGAVVVSVGVEPDGVPPGVLHRPGGPDEFRRLLDEQLQRHRHRRVPDVAADPRWTIVERGVDPVRHRVVESLFTLVSGGIGVRGSVEEAPGYGHPLVVANGVYGGSSTTDGLLTGPDPVEVDIDPPVERDVRILDLRTGTLLREEKDPSRVAARSLRFASLDTPAVLALRVEAGVGRLTTPAPEHSSAWDVSTSPGGGIGVVSEQTVTESEGMETVERLVAFDAGPSPASPDLTRARERLREATARGFDVLLCRQRELWASRWETVGVSIPDDPTCELALRFALFQLWGLADGGPELAVGARGLTGSGYSGHVFWDADVFVLPALVTIDPTAASALVAYRLNRMEAARRRAEATGHRGARFPWESALVGDDVTPTSGFLGGTPVPIRTGQLEEHITADVAWAVVHHAQWVRPSGRLARDEAELVAETARYWASRVRLDDRGRAHLDGVIGPDEYHEGVDDDVFTNAMARWNLRAAARLSRAPADERRRWRGLADAIVDGFDPVAGLYEQFRGYFSLEPLTMEQVAPPPVAADVLAGRDRIAQSQVVKQPDVLMAFATVPEEMVPGSLAANLDFYGPRTAHGSSLSPAIMALLEARAGRPDAALDLLRLALRIDLADLGGTTSSGVHLGTLGGAWQAMVRGFLGARVIRGELFLDPVLPAPWPELELRFRCLGRDVRVRVDSDVVAVETSAPLTVRLDRQGDRRLETGGTR